MNLPLASLHWTGFVAAALVGGAVVAADAVVVSASAAVTASIMRIISILLAVSRCWGTNIIMIAARLALEVRLQSSNVVVRAHIRSDQRRIAVWWLGKHRGAVNVRF